MDLNVFLQMMADRGASDLFLSVGASPAMKIDGDVTMLEMPALDAESIAGIANALMDEPQRRKFSEAREMNLMLAREGLGRFRVNIYRQRGHVGIAIRFVPAHVPSIESLNLPNAFKDLIMLPRGLVLVVGGAGSGKSTTLAAMIDHRNQNRAGHMLSIEDPIEFLHAHGKSIVDQREVGIDTNSYPEAMLNAMRQSPDVIMIGEIRDRQTMEQAMVYAQTGQLCLATLHANNASQTLDRIINFFPDSARKQVLLDLSLDLKAVISQRLVRNAKGGRRVPAVELLLQTNYVSDLIRAGDIDQLKEAMKQGIDRGMMTFEDSLIRLFDAGRITWNDALDNADSRSDLALRRRLAQPLGVAPEEDDGMSMLPSSVPGADAGIPHGIWTDGKSHDHRI